MLIVIQSAIIDQDKKKNHETNFRKTESKIKAIQKRQVEQHHY